MVHATAGTSALVIAKMLGSRQGFPRELNPPHSPGLVMMGAAMLWVGWFGFNAGSALAADGNAGMAMTVTHISAAAASLTWMGIEWVRFGKPSLVGIVTGMVAGLATITPASGYVGPLGGLVLGIAAGFLCFRRRRHREERDGHRRLARRLRRPWRRRHPRHVAGRGLRLDGAGRRRLRRGRLDGRAVHNASDRGSSLWSPGR